MNRRGTYPHISTACFSFPPHTLTRIHPARTAMHASHHPGILQVNARSSPWDASPTHPALPSSRSCRHRPVDAVPPMAPEPGPDGLEATVESWDDRKRHPAPSRYPSNPASTTMRAANRRRRWSCVAMQGVANGPSWVEAADAVSVGFGTSVQSWRPWQRPMYLSTYLARGKKVALFVWAQQRHACRRCALRFAASLFLVPASSEEPGLNRLAALSTTPSPPCHLPISAGRPAVTQRFP